MIYMLTAIGLTPRGTSSEHIYTKAIVEKRNVQHNTKNNRTTYLRKEQHNYQQNNTINNKNNTINNLITKSASLAPSLLVITLHLPYN